MGESSTKALPHGIFHKTLMRKAMGVEVGYYIYLPPSYESSSERFPVLYWLHGAGSDENAGLEGALQNATLLAASITLMKEENWERKFFCLLTSALMGDPFLH